MLGPLEEWTEDIFMPLGGFGLFLVAFFSSTFLIVPPDIILILLCLDAVGDPICIWYAMICTFGSVLGGVFGYHLGHVRGRPFMRFFMSERNIIRVEDAYAKYGLWTIAIAGLTPVPYNIFTIASGVMNYDIKKFILISVLSRGVRFLIIALLIMVWGKVLSDIIDERLLLAVTLAGGMVVTVFYLLHRYEIITMESK